MIKSKSVKNKTVKNLRNVAHIKPNKLKTELITKIKNYRQNNHNDNNNNNNNNINNNNAVLEKILVQNKPTLLISNKLDKSTHDTTKNMMLGSNSLDDDDFSQSINFLRELSSKTKKRTIKKEEHNFPISLGNPMQIDNPSQTPHYSCLKNGSLPTYREWKNTTIKKPIAEEPSDFNLVNPNKSHSDFNLVNPNKSLSDFNLVNPNKSHSDFRNNEEPDFNLENPNKSHNDFNLANPNKSHSDFNLANPNKSHNNFNLVNPNNEEEPKNEKLLNHSMSIPRKTTTLKYYLGKRGKKVSVLIKNSETRKKINIEHNLLKQTNITDMKNYLKRHNLLKSGSHAPPEIIKKLYEQSLLGGDIRNSNKNNIIHNYLAE